MLLGSSREIRAVTDDSIWRVYAWPGPEIPYVDLASWPVSLSEIANRKLEEARGKQTLLRIHGREEE